MKYFLTLLLLLVTLNTNAAENMDGHYLKRECTTALIVMRDETPPASKVIDVSYAFGFCYSAVRTVLGINTLYESVLEGKALFCMMDETIVFHELIQHILDWIQENPKQLKWNYDQVIVLALKAKYPCSTNLFKALKCEENYKVSL